MAYVKIEKVKNIASAVDYICQEYKTNGGKFIDSHRCETEYAATDFRYIHNQKIAYDDRRFSVKAWVIYQSFKADEVAPEDAHKLGIELADRYLGSGHQRVIATHIDTKHIHNHIIFNAVNCETYKCFDSKTKHIIGDLRTASNDICAAHGLSIIVNPRGKGCSQREYYARQNNRSYKARIEKLIDIAIEKSVNLDDFFERMSEFGTIEQRGGNYSVMLYGQKKPTRLSSLGFDYSIESIRSRIKNKDLSLAEILGITEQISAPVSEPDEKLPTFEASKIKSGTQFSISDSSESLLHILGATRRKNVESTEYRKSLQETVDSLNTIVEIIESTDDDIARLEEYVKHKKIFEVSLALMREYKATQDRFTFREKHISEFRAYDAAKKVVFAHERDGKLPAIEEVQEEIDALRESRGDFYSRYLKIRAGLPADISSAGAALNGQDDYFSASRLPNKAANAQSGDKRTDKTDNDIPERNVKRDVL